MSTDRGTDMAQGLARRLWTYQAERFPVGKTALLTLAFSSASVTASAVMGGRAPPSAQAYLTAFALAFSIMLSLRVLDEFKDRRIDAMYRPERPVPRGLVTLREVAGLGVAGTLVAVAAALALSPGLLLPLAGVAAFMVAMTLHFGVPRLMHASLLLTLLSHMLVMPAMDFLVTACEWLPRAGAPPRELWTFLALSFANGCVLEIGRKTWAPGNERPNVESYSSAWGVRTATGTWLAFLAAALALIVVLLATMGSAPVAALAAVAAALAGAVGWRFRAAPTGARQKALDDASGYWILASYLIAGYGALLWKVATA